MCLPWPETPINKCKGGEYKALDKTMRPSDTASCQALCQQEQQEGCCWLKTGFGCYWKAGGKATIDGGSAMATTCYPGKHSVKERAIK